MTLHSDIVYCAVCGTGRERPKISFPYSKILLGSFLAALLMGCTSGLIFSLNVGVWTAFGTAVLSFFGNEVYISLKFRRELDCPVCNFNPVLYRRSPEKAKERCLKSLRGKRSQFIDQWQALKNREVAKSPVE